MKYKQPSTVHPKLIIRKKKKNNMQFREAEHTYVDDNIKYTPVTYFIKSFVPYVDWDQKCKEKAAKLGITFEELRLEWNKTRDDASAKGTAFHRVKELEYLNGKEIVIDNTLCPIETAPTRGGIKTDESMILKDNTVYVEKMIWSRKYGICGTADLVEVVNGKVYVKDYKTNAELKFVGFKGERMKAPVNDLQNCNFNHYQLQLNTYMFMLLQANRNLKFGGMEILHVQYDKNGEYTGMQVHQVDKMADSISKMMKTFQLKKK